MSELKFSFNIDNFEYVGVPKTRNISNEFDEFGLFASLKRFPGETNRAYKRRLKDVYVHRSNSTYNGLVFGITRELGLELSTPIRIYPLKNSGEFVAPNPVVEFIGPTVKLWSNYLVDLDIEFDRYEQTGSAYQIRDLVSYINENSTYFRSDLLDPSAGTDRSMTLMNQTNIINIRQEVIPQSNRFTLQYPGQDGGAIMLSTVQFSDTLAFSEEVANDSLVTFGKYFINKNTGDVFTGSFPQADSVVRYKSITNDWRPLASPVIIHDIHNEDFKKKMFEQVFDDLGNQINGLPSQFGADIFNELMSIYPLYYGK